MTPSKKKALALWLLIAPTGLLILSFILFIFGNIIIGATDRATDTNIFSIVLNTILFFVGLLGFLSWLPGLIIGIVLLANKPTVTPPSPPTPPQGQ